MSNLIIYNKIIPLKGYKAINLFGIIFVRTGSYFSSRDLLHEKIHTAQMREMLFIFFYIWYVLEFSIRFIISLFRHRSDNGYWYDAYVNISFEKEAYQNQIYPEFLSKRKHFNWIKFL